MIDLHCHLLPGIDDGPATLDESLEMCRIAVADGISGAVCTPHIHPGRWHNSRRSIARECEQLQRALDERGIPLQLGFAAEVRLTDQVITQVESGEIPCYGETGGCRVLLLEFPHGHLVAGSDRLARWLLQRDIRPLIAHPERNRQVMRDVSALRPLIEVGCWLQITAGSITGAFGEGAQRAARQLLEQDAVTAVASDAHNTRFRRPLLGEAFKRIASDYGEARARRLLSDTPAAIALGRHGVL
jgi:protein-tyrosine phosphatase